MLNNIRVITPNDITSAVARLCIESAVYVNNDIRRALSEAKTHEASPLAIHALDQLLENAKIAEREGLPICQDTGMAVVFVKIGSHVIVDGDINEAINEGVRQGYREGYCRNSVVADPLERKNTNDNTPAVIHYELTAGTELCITVTLKGFGSENMSGIRMLNPSDGLPAITNYIVDTVRRAGSNPCPPIIVGVGIGGTMEKAALLAKQALLREIGSSHPSAFWAEAEKNILARINQLNIGAAGFGGAVTALGVNILTYPTHIAGLPVAVNIGCHATRHRTAVL